MIRLHRATGEISSLRPIVSFFLFFFLSLFPSLFLYFFHLFFLPFYLSVRRMEGAYLTFGPRSNTTITS